MPSGETSLMRLIALACRIIPIKSGIGTMSQFFSRKVPGLRNSVEVPCKLRNRVRIMARLDDYNGRMLYLFGTPDPKVISICKGLLRQGDVFLDIGANYGSVALLVHESVGPTGWVHLVEPQPELGDRISGAIAHNAIKNMTLHRCGLWDERGEFFITGSQTHTGTASISAEAVSEDSHRVEVRDIEGFLRETSDGKSIGVKLDVEGAEVRLLPTLLTHPQLRFVLFESHDQEVKSFVRSRMGDQSSAFFGVSKSLFRTRLFRISNDEDLQHAHDILAVQRSGGANESRYWSVKKLRKQMA
jgi:FkbM family methyltransferase